MKIIKGTMMKLYDMKHAPNPRRVRMFLAEKGVEIEKHPIDIPSGENLKPEYLKINPRGLVPSLVLDDGTVIGESVAICRYIEEIYPDPPLMGVDSKDKAVVEDWQRQMEFDGLMSLAWVFRNTNPIFENRALPGITGGLKQSSEMADIGRQRAFSFFETLNDRLKDVPFVAGERFTIADITAYMALMMARWVKISVPEDHVHIKSWYEKVSQRPSAKA